MLPVVLLCDSLLGYNKVRELHSSLNQYIAFIYTQKNILSPEVRSLASIQCSVGLNTTRHQGYIR